MPTKPSRYKEHVIPKRDGSIRTLLEPDPELKEKQKKILLWLTKNHVKPSKFAHAFTKGRSVKTAAKYHTGKAVVIRVDLQDFFPSISERMLIEALNKKKLSDKAYEIAETCSVGEGPYSELPQGAPTSPLLSNLAAEDLDARIWGLCKSWIKRRKLSYKITYTRYSDDLIFSSNYRKLNQMLPAIYDVIRCCRFEVNPKKTRIMRRHRRQNVLGLTVNKALSTSRKYRKRVRAELHQLWLKALQGEHPGEDRLERLQGKIAYIEMANVRQAAPFKRRLKMLKQLAERNLLRR